MAEANYAANPLAAIAVTVAHEYNHVVQFGYTYDADSWMSESTATALEELVFPDINDYVNYVSALASRVEVPFTTNDGSGKVYAGSTFNLFLARRHGPRTLPAMWAQSLRTTPLDFGLEAYNRGIQRRTAGRSSFLREFVHYAASLPEWQTSGVYADGASFREVERSATLRRGNPSLLALHHTTYRLLDVVQRSGSRVRLLGRAPRGIRSGIALVGRRTDGEIETVVRLLPRGGAGSVSLQKPAAYDRITAVLVNAHRGIRGGFDSDIGDWPYTGDRKGYAARLAPEKEKESLAG
jgi:hypothetical protein